MFHPRLDVDRIHRYLRKENRILRERLGHKRTSLNESQKRRLATAVMKLGKYLLRRFETLFSPAPRSAGTAYPASSLLACKSTLSPLPWPIVMVVLSNAHRTIPIFLRQICFLSP